MAKNVLLHLQVLIIFYLGLLHNSADARCMYLSAESFEQSFESHHDYGYYDYSNYEDKCWIIRASSFYKSVNIETEGFDLEPDSLCRDDYVLLSDGDSHDYYNDYIKYCGTGHFEITSSTDAIYLQFVTDGSITGEGFRLKYKQVDSSEYDSDDWDNMYNNLQSGLVGWAIFLVVVGVIILVIIIIVVIVVMVVCIIKSSKSRGRVMNGTAQQGGTMVVQNGQNSYIGGPGGVIVQPPAYGQHGMQPPAYNEVISQQGGMGMTAIHQPQYQKSPYPQQLAVNLQNGTTAPMLYQQPAVASTPQMNESTNPNDIPPPPMYTEPVQK